jgi:hypothetical protein
MPLALEALPHVNADNVSDSAATLTTEERFSQFIRNEIDGALRDVDRRKRLAEAELAQQARRASKRVVASGHRLERSLRGSALPVLPLAIGMAIIGTAFLFERLIQEQ